MSNQVFANHMEIACKQAAGKAICAFPDVCFTPPLTPATPPGVPIPYPNTGLASDCSDGSSTVKVSGQEVMLKNKSHFKTSSGNEAGSAPKKGVVTSTNKGKSLFNAWSMDVKFEGENVDRHFDLTTHNHNPPPGNSPPWLYTDTAASGGKDDAGKCKDVANAVERDCKNTSYKNDQSGACCKAKKCVLSPYGSQPECCGNPAKTKHHVVPDHCFKDKGDGDYYQGIKDMSYARGLCICVTGEDKNEKRKQHAKIHRDFDDYEDKRPNSKWTFGEASDKAAEVCEEHTDCDKDCLKQQMSQYYEKKGVNDGTVLRADSSGNRASPPRSEMGTRMTTGSNAVT